jgi:hypothetical protein
MVKKALAVFVCLALSGTTPVLADWSVGEPSKMHYPQLPDPNGWDVNFTWPNVLADDWRCTESGPVSDIHFWYSFRQDRQAPITGVHASIHADVPKSPTDPYSHPGALLWESNFAPALLVFAGPFQGREGWYDPNVPFYEPFDHLLYWQINIENIQNPFRQEANTIYWLDLSVMLSVPPPTGNDPNQYQIGWKTSLNHFNDDAVWWNGQHWVDLHDPLNPQQSLDMAFVITPEPGTAALLALGGLAALRRKRRL